jgi:hypothetical protein
MMWACGSLMRRSQWSTWQTANCWACHQTSEALPSHVRHTLSVVIAYAHVCSYLR